ncbi:MAG TPA: peptidoglycan-associated lipoprotein Pal [Bryobacteraceae bacterium]|nr:peptidoglycan-associated lipoprotein Pal [Bryobacteraceae bacterium]
MTESRRLHTSRIGIGLLMLVLFFFASGCKKKVPPPPPPPTPTRNEPAPTPTVQPPVIANFSAEPSTIEKGQSSTLSWSINGATDMSIDNGIGPVQSRGTRQVFPANTTTYTLTAKGPGGTVTRSATVSVSTAPGPLPPPSGPKLSSTEMLQQQSQDAYFDYDKSDIRADAREALSHDAELLKQIFQQDPNFNVIIEGHCDERGSAEYNLALGDRRASAAKEYLVQLGAPADRLKTISYGKERPQCTEASEACWQKNRRAHLAAGQ